MKNFNRNRQYEIISIMDTITVEHDNLDVMKAREVWEISRQGEGNVVAILDTGIDVNHDNLSQNIIGGYNFTKDDGGDPDAYIDYDGHGTHVAGIIGAYKTSTGRGLYGVAPKCKLLILKVLDQYGRGSYEQVVRAIQYAINWTGPNGEKVNVINMSLGGRQPDESLHAALKIARQKGIVLVSAAGNNGDGDPNSFEKSYPGYYKEVIQVGSVNANLEPSLFSNNNVNLDFVAPGENVYSTHLNNRFVKLTGTSMAAPYVSGAIALILNILKKREKPMIPYAVYHYLLTHARKLDFSIYQVGNGLVQLTSQDKRVIFRGLLTAAKKLEQRQDIQLK